MSEFLQAHINKLQTGLVSKMEDIIVVKLIENGIDPNDHSFLSVNISRVIIEGDPFEHYYFRYGQPDEKRIVSIEICPSFDWEDNGTTINVTANKRYY